MTTMLFCFSDRDAAHQKLEEVRRAQGPTSQAECREDPNSAEPYQVWSGPSGMAR